MCDYEDMRDSETQSTAGQCEEERERLSYLRVHCDIHRIKGNNVQAIDATDIVFQCLTG